MKKILTENISKVSTDSLHYAGFCKCCGSIVAWVIDQPGNEKITSQLVSSFIEASLEVKHCTLQELELSTHCQCSKNKPEPVKNSQRNSNKKKHNLTLMSSIGVKELESALPDHGIPIFEDDDFDISLLKDFQINKKKMLNTYSSLIRKLERHGVKADDITPEFIMKQTKDSLLEVKSFGKVSTSALISLKEVIREDYKTIKRSDFENLNYLEHKLNIDDFSLHQIAEIFTQDLKEFCSILDNESLYIWENRLGLNTGNILTLVNIGKQFLKTRERIRQQEIFLIKNMRLTMRISPQIIYKKLIEANQASLKNDLAPLYEYFKKEYLLINAISIICDVKFDDVQEIFNPSIKKDILDPFFCLTPYPATVSSALAYLQKSLDMDSDRAERYLEILIKKNLVIKDQDFLKPINTRNKIAIAHMLASFPDGCTYSEIQEAINKSGICRYRWTNEKPSSFFSKYFYMSSLKHYRHIRYLNLTDELITYWLEEMYKALYKPGLKELKLRDDFYDQRSPKGIDYFALRYIAHTYGYRMGIFFFGKSCKDTITLTNETKTMRSIKDSILRALDKGSMTMDEITKATGSKIITSNTIKNLMKEGKILKIGNDRFSAMRKAECDVDMFVETIDRLLEESSKPYYIPTLINTLNETFSLSYYSEFYRPILSAYKSSKNWHINRFVISKRPISKGFGGLTGFVKNAPKGLSSEELSNWIQSNMVIEKQTIIKFTQIYWL
jgi:hypothetical protein